jgi:hypothetical protein
MLRVNGVDRASPWAGVLWIGLILLGVKIWTCAASLQACRARSLAIRRDVGERWGGWLLDDRKVGRGCGSDLEIWAVRRKSKWLDEIRICLHCVSFCFLRHWKVTDKIEKTEKIVELM